MTKFNIGDKVMYEEKEYTIKVSQKNHATGVIRYQLEGLGHELINEDKLERISEKENVKAKKQFAKDLIKLEEKKQMEEIPEIDEEKPLKRTKNK